MFRSNFPKNRYPYLGIFFFLKKKYAFLAILREKNQNFPGFAILKIGIFSWKIGPMFRDFLQRTDPKLRHITICLNMWVHPSLGAYIGLSYDSPYVRLLSTLKNADKHFGWYVDINHILYANMVKLATNLVCFCLFVCLIFRPMMQHWKQRGTHFLELELYTACIKLSTLYIAYEWNKSTIFLCASILL